MLVSGIVSHSTRITMRSVRVREFGGPKKLLVEDQVKIPKITHSNEVLMRMHYAGVNPVDTYIRERAYSRVPDLPYTPGMDGAGVVEAVGTDVKHVKVGDRVFCVRSSTGTYAQYSLSSANLLWKLPDHVTFAQGAAIGIPYFTAYRALFLKCHAKKGETVLVHGASGAVGLAACQIAASAGCTVLGTASSDAGKELVKQAGAHQVFDHKHKGYLEQIMEATKDEGVDVILEMLSNVNLAHDLDLMASRGRTAIIGSRGQIRIDPRAMMFKESSVIGVALMTATDSEWAEMGAAIEKGLHDHKYNPIVGREYDMTDVQQSHVDVIEHKGGACGKLVLKIDQ